MNFAAARKLPTMAVFAVLFLLPAPALIAQTDGIYADFSTSMGNFTCRLYYEDAPKATANFIGLATGKKAWLDNANGLAKSNAFYNGLIFHRVIANFMIQGGSHTGTGSGDPGYAFQDEFKSTLRFDGAGVLAMANSGPGSNGSQFFITVAATPHLNDAHTIFGRVTSGQAVVDNISKVAVDSDSRPLTNVVIQSVQIRRVGAAAENFNIDAQGLPIVANRSLNIEKTAADQVTLSFANRLYTDTRIYGSTNLTPWSGSALGRDTTLPVTTNSNASTESPRRFFRAVQVDYPSALPVPMTMDNRTLVLRFNGYGTNTTVFHSAGGGSYSWPGIGSGDVVFYNWTQEPYRGRLWPVYWSGYHPFYLRLDFLTATNGNFSGHQDVSGAPVSGTFTLSP
jgi:peptidyl-prolyl cis-trans isomerase A (cyclophilin A)